MINQNLLNDFLSQESLILAVEAIIIVIGALIADRIIRRAIASYSRKIGLVEHVENIFKLIGRIIVFGVSLIILLQLFEIDATAIMGIGAISGAAIGFASTQTVGNFLAGFYILISRPFLVKDFVKIGNTVGLVKEITINYTKIYTPTYNLMEIPNRKILDSNILNYSKGDIVDYTFEFSFPALLPKDISNKELIEKCILPATDHFYKENKEVFTKKPELAMSNLDRLERKFSIRIFFEEKFVDYFYDHQPELLNDITERWDLYRKEKTE